MQRMSLIVLQLSFTKQHPEKQENKQKLKTIDVFSNTFVISIQKQKKRALN